MKDVSSVITYWPLKANSVVWALVKTNFSVKEYFNNILDLSTFLKVWPTKRIHHSVGLISLSFSCLSFFNVLRRQKKNNGVCQVVQNREQFKVFVVDWSICRLNQWISLQK